MSTTLRALTTLALERGRADTGQVFQMHDETAAAELVAAGLAELVAPDPAAAQKEEKQPLKTKEDKSAPKTK